MTKKETRDRQYLNVTIVTHSEGKDMPLNFKYKKRHNREKPMALDVLPVSYTHLTLPTKA